MMPPELRYTLNVRGIEETVLVNAPIEWQKMTINYGRSDTFFGVIRDLTDPLEFVTRGATILRTELYRTGTKSNVKLRIEVLQNDWSYKVVYYGSLDFSTAVDGDTSVTITGKDDDIASLIKAYADAQYEIPVNVPAAVTLQISPLRLLETANLIFTPQGTKLIDFFPGISIVNNDVKATVATVQAVTLLQKTDPAWATTGKNFFTAATTSTVNISGYLDITTVNNNFYYIGQIGGTNTKINAVNTLTIGIYNQNGIELKRYFTTSETSRSYHVDLTAAIPVNAGDKLYVYFDSNTDGHPNALFGDGYFEINQGELDLTYYTQSPATPCKCLPGKYLFDQILQNINDGLKVETSSYLLNTQWKQLLFTCGDALRQLTTKQITNADDTITTVAASPVIKTSLNDFFKSVNAVTNCGLGNENGKIVLENKVYFYRPSTRISTFPGVKTVKISVDTSLLYNTIKGGYPDQTYDQLNGRDEVNSEVNWITPNAATDGQTKELDLQSKYRGDCYGIEYARINLSGKASIDSSSDNDTFMIYANPDLTAPLAAEGLKFFSGTSAGSSLYNWFISPKRNLLRHGNYLRACFFQLDNYRIKFGTALKNKDLITTDLTGFAVKESADILISSLDAPLFSVYKVSLTAEMARETLGFVDSAMYGFFDFTYKGATVKCFISDFKFDISKDSSQEFTGIITADTDFYKLIR